MTAETLQSSEGWLGRLAAVVGRRVMPRRLRGCLRVTLPSGRMMTLGQPGTGMEADLQLHSFSGIRRSVTRGSVGFAESFMAGEWSSSDITRLIRFYIHNRAGLERAGRLFFFSSPLDRLWHLTRANTRKGSRRNIAAHYDLGNDFYKLWLDPGMTYSSALFRSPDMSLAAAQDEKNALVLKELRIKPGDRLLEIGCGWGGFAEAACTRGALVTGVTLSEQQLAYATERLGGKAEFRLQDYRDTTGTFDAIASIEMIEAVGEENWPVYFRTIHERLKPGGSAVIQAITIDEPLFAEYRRSADFIQRYIFPGGFLPTPDRIRKHAEAAGLSCTRLEHFGESYARTLGLWRERFEESWPAIAALGFDDRFRRMWHFYLCYCEAGFAEKTIDVGLFRFERTK